MSKTNNREVKAQRRLLNFLRKQTSENNKTHYRMVNGQLFPYVLRQHDYVREYQEGLIYVTEVRHNEFEIITSIDYLKNTILSIKGSKILIERKGVIMNMDDQQRPEDTRDLPEVTQKPVVAQGEETPGQVPAVEKNRIEVPDVSHAGEKLEADQRADEERKAAEEAKAKAEAEAQAQTEETPGEATTATPSAEGTAQEPATPEVPAQTPEVPAETPSEPTAPSTEDAPANPSEPEQPVA